MSAPALTLLCLSLLSFICLSFTTVSAEETVLNNVDISVPVSCNLNSSVDTAHTAIVNAGTSVSDIGTTNFTVFCNDASGFALYAIGYTNEDYGDNTLVGQTTSNIINTGQATSGNTSAWAMKMVKVTDGSYQPNNLTITNSFNNYHNVPDTYTKVAQYTASTDFTLGSKLQSTYRAFMSTFQDADTYNGKVKYTLVHPYTAPEPVPDDQVAIIYDGNGLTFPGGGSTNRVVYGNTCTSTYGYVSNTYQEVMTSNITTGGTQNGSYTDHENILRTITLPNADRVKVVVDYGVTGDTISATIAEGTWAGWNDGAPGGYYKDIYSWTNSSGTESFIFEGGTITIDVSSSGTPESGYDKGFYIKIYPVYNEETEGTTRELMYETCIFSALDGAYAETTTGGGYWYATIGGDDPYLQRFYNEDDVKQFIENDIEYLGGTTITLYAYNPYFIYYDGNNATAGTMEGVSTKVDYLEGTFNLIAPNFYKTGYGFAGWSESENATVNGNNIIYGPNETITGSELSFDNNSRSTTLYAVWVSTTGTMQNWSGCSSMSSGQITALTDSRDNNVYTVGKMQDGNCWMMENLRLNNTATGNTDGLLAQGYGTGFIGLADPETADFNNSTTANTLYSTSNITGNYQGYRFPRYSNKNTKINDSSLVASPGCDHVSGGCKSGDYKWYSYGNYYTYAASMANITNFTTYDSETANTSICPSNWSLPYGGTSGRGATSGGFAYLDIRMGGTGGTQESSNRWRSFPNNFVYSGYSSYNNTYDSGNFGIYYSSTSFSGDYARCLAIADNYVRLDNYAKSSGDSIRCLTH